MIIGISGYKQGGKTTLAQSIFQEFWPEGELKESRPVKVLSFADALKDIINLCFSDRRKSFEVNVEKEALLPCGKSARYVLQVVGTDWFRSLDKDCWVRAYKKRAKGTPIFLADSAALLTPDVRFPNEVKCIQDLGGKVLRLLRRPFPDDNHESETALNKLQQRTIDYQKEGFPPSTVPTDIAHELLLYFDAIIDNREMSMQEKNEAGIEIVKRWLKKQK